MKKQTSDRVVKREQEAALKKLYRENYAPERRAVRDLKKRTEALIRKAQKLMEWS
jgi:hypothetical protein